MSVRNALQKVDTVRHAAGGALKQERHPSKLSAARGLAGVRSARKPRKLFI